MTDKRLNGTNEPNALFVGPVVDGLFVWNTVADAVAGDPVALSTDGPPIGVIKAVVNAKTIGVVKQPAKQTEKVVVITKFTAIVAMVSGDAITQGALLKTDAASKVIEAVIGDVGTGATGITEGAILGQALQSAGGADDIIYVGITG